MIISKWGFSNMLSYGDDNVFVVNKGVTQLLGKNGEGKSSIATILEELLYNKNSRGIKKSEIQNRYSGKSGYSGFVEFRVEDTKYTLTKIVSGTAKLTLLKNGVDISGHTTTQTYKMLEQEIIRMDFSTFTKLSYQSMVSSLDFLTATDGNRKKFLISLLGLDEYAETEKTLKEATKESKRILDETKGKIKTLKEWIKDSEDMPETMVEKEVPIIDDSMVDALSSLSADILNIAEKNKTIRNNNKIRDKLTKLVIPDEVEEIDTTVAELELADRKTSRSVCKQIQTSASLEKNKIAAIEENCHVCGGILDVGNKEEMLEKADKAYILAKKEYDKYDAVVKTSEKEIVLLRAKSKEYLEYLRVTSEEEVLKTLLSTDIPLVEITSETLESEVLSLKKVLSDVRLSVKTAIKFNAVAIKTNSKIEYMQEQLHKFTEELKDVTSTLSAVHDNHTRLSLLTKSFGSKGLIAYKIESMVKVFEKLINEYLRVLSGGTFELAFSILDSKLVLDTFSSGKPIDIKSLSSGEFNRVNTATLLAIRTMMTSICKTDLNILILDEVISVLDQEGKETLIAVLRNEHNLDSVVVSHAYQHPLTRKVRVTKKNNISRIENEHS